MIGKRFGSLLAVALLCGMAGCHEYQVVPAGTKVIVMDRDGNNTVYDKGLYTAWGYDVEYSLDTRLETFKETLPKVLCKDNIALENVDVKLICSFDVSDTDPKAAKAKLDFIREKVPVTGDGKHKKLELKTFAELCLIDILRNSGRTCLTKVNSDTAVESFDTLSAACQELVISRVKELKYPVAISAVMYGNLSYPKTIETSRNAIKEAELKELELAAKAEAKLAEKKREAMLATEEAKVRLIEARAKADENDLLAQSLTPEFLQWTQFEVLQKMAKAVAEGPNNTVFMFPMNLMDKQLLNTAVTADAIKDLKPKAKSQLLELPSRENTASSK